MNILVTIVSLLVSMILGYLIGSIPTGIIIGKMHGIDIREYGSHNAGGTNVGRILGKKAGLMTIILDILKCYLALAIVLVFFSLCTAVTSHLAITDLNLFIELAVSLTAIAACIGHTFPIYAQFKGGKCVACFAGYILFISPLLFILGMTLFFILLKITKTVSICSIITVPSVWLMSGIPMILHFTIAPTGFNGGIVYVPDLVYLHMTYISFITVFLLAGLVVIRHKANIQRIKAGTEKETHFENTIDPNK